uniref:Secreted periplasmic Zn-dependent protease n=2 Tax=environmental samples TaxID=651140 RepID=A0A075GKF0_9ARCH|nr:hypothetical protein [uncultured marine thaumarchaeote KM3_156_B03]AIF04804.1 hypothetical protein [uncultured marine thaumarchaeote KM3_176_H06]
MLFVPASISAVQAQDSEIPSWIKNNAGWWATDLIDDSSFLQGIQYLIKEGIMVIPPTETSDSSGSGVPAWIKNNAGWWADGQIDDGSFVSGIQWLISNGIIVVEQEQTQPTVSDNEIQKLADEYWDCLIGDPVPSPICIEYDEDKYTVGGIEELTFISGYQVFDGTGDDSNWRMNYHNPVDAKLEKFQDEDLHKQLFDMYVSITPKQLLDEVAYLDIATDDYGGKEAAAVGRGDWEDDLRYKYWLSIDPLDMAPSAGPIDEMYHKATMIHENAHILSLGSSQSDNDNPFFSTGIADLYVEPYTELRKIIQEKESACAPNYYDDASGCMKDNSYMNKFFQEFWIDIYPSFKWFYEFDDYDKFLDHNDLFYKKYKTQFVTDYAQTNPSEDFAESFTAFVLKEKPTKSIITDQKILFFYDFPELVEMRDFIRSNL